jgi:hypothetical protein
MPHTATNDYQITINQISIDPTDPLSPTTVLFTVVGPRQELDLNRFTVAVSGNERMLDLNDLNRTKTPAPNLREPDVLDNPYQNGVCIMPHRFNSASDVYRLSVAFHRMSGRLPSRIETGVADLFFNSVSTKTLLASSGLLLTPAIVTATTPTGRWVTHTHTLTNAYSTTRVYTLTARSAQGWTVIIEPKTVALAAGESVTFTTSVSVPGSGYVVAGTMDCVVVEILPSQTYPPVREFYLPLILRGVMTRLLQ